MVLAIDIVYDTHSVVGIFVFINIIVVVSSVMNPAIYAYVISL